MIAMGFMCRTFDSGLVEQPAALLSVAVCLSNTILSFTQFRTEGFLVCMCWDVEWCAAFFDSSSTPSLSTHTFIAVPLPIPSSCDTRNSHIPPLHDSDVAAYSASVDESATDYCFLEFQYISPA